MSYWDQLDGIEKKPMSGKGRGSHGQRDILKNAALAVACLVVVGIICDLNTRGDLRRAEEWARQPLHGWGLVTGLLALFLAVVATGIICWRKRKDKEDL